MKAHIKPLKPQQFTKKPVTVEAIRWTGENLMDVISFTDGPPDTRSHHAGMMWDNYADLVGKEGLKIFTLEGKMNADIGDWIIKGLKGEFYPCKPDIFEATYTLNWFHGKASSISGNIDQVALDCASEIMGLFGKCWNGREAQLKAAVQCSIIEAIDKVKSPALSASAEPSAPIIHPINMKVMMQAYEQVDHKALLHGTSNWCASMATALRGVLQGQPSAPVERDERAEFEHWECYAPEGPQVDPMWMSRCTIDRNAYGIASVQKDWEAWQARECKS